MPCEDHLADIVDAHNAVGARFGPRKGRKQDCGKNSDNRNYDEEFNQRKRHRANWTNASPHL
jgi:hypothetical protein